MLLVVGLENDGTLAFICAIIQLGSAASVLVLVLESELEEVPLQSCEAQRQ